MARNIGGSRSKRAKPQKFTEDSKPVIKEKFLQKRKEEIESKPVVPLNERQAEYFQAIREKDLVIATGFAGTSKTYIATCLAADAYRLGQCTRIVLTRPALSDSQSLGYFGGDVNQKVRNWIMPMLSVLYQRMGKDVVDEAIEDGNIQLQPLETIKGMSYGKGTWVIADEIQDCKISEIKSIVTRGGGCKMILCGDVRQSALKEDSGLAIFASIVNRNPRLMDTIAHIDFDSHEHIVRSKVCRDLIMAFDKSGY